RSPVPSCGPPWLLAGTTGTSPTLVSTCARTRGCWAPRDCECTSYPRVGSVDNHRHAGRRTTRMLDVPVQEVLAELGGGASRAELLRHVTEYELRQALNRGMVRRPARGRYALPVPSWTRERAELA